MILHLPRNDYGLILADPAWAFETYSGTTQTPTQKDFNQAEDHYPTMPLAEMAALPVADFAAKDCALAMWVVGSHLDVALDLGRDWGFKYKTDVFWWLKQKMIEPNQLDIFTLDIPQPPMSMGYYSRKQMEQCLLFTRGKPKVCANDVRQLIVASKRGHSRKPDEQYSRLERLFGDVPRAELFSRTSRKGWDAWGNEVGKFEEVMA